MTGFISSPLKTAPTYPPDFIITEPLGEFLTTEDGENFLV